MTMPADYVFFGILEDAPPYAGDRPQDKVRRYETASHSYMLNPLDYDRTPRGSFRHQKVLAPTPVQKKRAEHVKLAFTPQMVQDKDKILFVLTPEGEVFVSPEVQKALDNYKNLPSNSLRIEMLRDIAREVLERLEQERLEKQRLEQERAEEADRERERAREQERQRREERSEQENDDSEGGKKKPRKKQREWGMDR